MRIWCRLVLRDNWKDLDTTLDPPHSCSHTMLLKTANLAASSGKKTKNSLHLSVGVLAIF